jgi:hypothetical protein
LGFDGFKPEAVDKVMRLLTVLDRIGAHPFLKERVCLHGGTAINLFLLNAPRLSVDIDLNYIGSPDVQVMYAERPRLEDALADVARELGYRVEAGAEEHAGRHFKLMFESAYSRDYVKVDVDYLNRSPLIKPERRRVCLPDGSAIEFPLNSAAELVGGKLKALLGRVVPRDLYDVWRISGIFDDLLESCGRQLTRRIIIYSASLSDPFPRPFDVTSRFIGKDRDFKESLLPMLMQGEQPNLLPMIGAAQDFVLRVTAPVDDAESEYLMKASAGVFCPALLFEAYPDVLRAAGADPAALWKMQNLKQAGRPKSLDNL